MRSNLFISCKVLSPLCPSFQVQEAIQRIQICSCRKFGCAASEQSPHDLNVCLGARQEIHRRNGKLMNRKIPTSSYFQTRPDQGKTGKWISKPANSSLVLTFTVSCQFHWFLEPSCSCLHCLGFVLQRRFYDNRITWLQGQKISAYGKYFFGHSRYICTTKEFFPLQ